MDSEAQSRRVITGREFEYSVMDILNGLLVPYGIRVVKGTKGALQSYLGEENAKRIIDYSRIPVKRRCDQLQLEDYPDSDLFILFSSGDSWKALGIISCKVSLHARHTETCFWGLLTHISSRMKYLFVFMDKDILSGKSSELGRSCNSSRSPRRLLEAFTDRVYILSSIPPEELEDKIECFKKEFGAGFPLFSPSDHFPVFDDPAIDEHTEYCRGVRPFDDLIFDIIRWVKEERS